VKTSEGTTRSASTGKLAFALMLMALAATLAAALSPSAALAGGGRHHRDSADVTFTKWIVSLPADPTTLAGVEMAGVVGGDVGRGRYTGLIIGDDTTTLPGFWLGHARYEFHGRRHSFIADLQITENDTVNPITATIAGVVTRGWLRGAQVTGQYRQWDVCPIPTPGNVLGTTCFQGTLHLQRSHHGWS
jgi:hypothetical protein